MYLFYAGALSIPDHTKTVINSKTRGIKKLVLKRSKQTRPCSPLEILASSLVNKMLLKQKVFNYHIYTGFDWQFSY